MKLTEELHPQIQPKLLNHGITIRNKLDDFCFEPLRLGVVCYAAIDNGCTCFPQASHRRLNPKPRMNISLFLYPTIWPSPCVSHLRNGLLHLPNLTYEAILDSSLVFTKNSWFYLLSSSWIWLFTSPLLSLPVWPHHRSSRPVVIRVGITPLRRCSRQSIGAAGRRDISTLVLFIFTNKIKKLKFIHDKR